MLSARTVIATGPDTASHPGVVYHEQLAKGWERRYRRGAFKRRAAFFADNVLPLGPRRGDWIDVGCGSGHFSRMLAKEGASVLGLDGSAAMLNAARSASAGLSDVRFEPRAVENLQSLQGDRDGVLCLSVLEYLDAPEAAVAAMACALKPGGRLILSAPNSRGFLRGLQSRLRRLAGFAGFSIFGYLERSRQSWSERELRAMAARNGLVCGTLLGFDPLTPRFLWRVAPPSLLFLDCRRSASGHTP